MGDTGLYDDADLSSLRSSMTQMSLGIWRMLRGVEQGLSCMGSFWRRAWQSIPPGSLRLRAFILDKHPRRLPGLGTGMAQLMMEE